MKHEALTEEMIAALRAAERGGLVRANGLDSFWKERQRIEPFWKERNREQPRRFWATHVSSLFALGYLKVTRSDRFGAVSARPTQEGIRALHAKRRRSG